ncbi:MAG: GAF domain-containing protein [Syntrophobacterales bacterium]
MKKQLMNYETMLKVAGAISMSKDPEEVMLLTVESVKTALEIKGCVLFLVNRKTNELEVGASYGLSEDYLNKGPVSSLHSIAESLQEGPVAIYDIADDPRIQYPEEAKREGIASILSAPIMVRGNVIGALRIYAAQPWEFTLEDVNFVQAVAQMAGMAIEMSRLYKGLKDSIEILKVRRDPKTLKFKLAQNS